MLMTKEHMDKMRDRVNHRYSLIELERSWLPRGPWVRLGTKPPKTSKYVCGGCWRSVGGLYWVQTEGETQGEWVCEGCRSPQSTLGKGGKVMTNKKAKKDVPVEVEVEEEKPLVDDDDDPFEDSDAEEQQPDGGENEVPEGA